MLLNILKHGVFIQKDLSRATKALAIKPFKISKHRLAA